MPPSPVTRFLSRCMLWPAKIQSSGPTTPFTGDHSYNSCQKGDRERGWCNHRTSHVLEGGGTSRTKRRRATSFRSDILAPSWCHYKGTGNEKNAISKRVELCQICISKVELDKVVSTDVICLYVQARSLLFDVQNLVKKTVKFVPAFLNNFNKPTDEVLRDSARVVFIPIFHC